MILSTIFISVAVLLCLVSVLAIYGITDVSLSGHDAIERDGMMPGRMAPRWSLPDAAGNEHHSPPDQGVQMIVFGDHSLKSFPSMVEGLRDLAASATGLEILILPRFYRSATIPVLRLLGLGEVPVLTPSEKLFGRYNVRVSPWVITVDSRGRVRGSSLVNYGWQVVKLYQMASVELPAEAEEPPRRLGRLLSRAWG